MATLQIEERSTTLQKSNASRSPPPPSPLIRNQSVFNTKYLQLLILCDLALPFLVCLVKQDVNPLSVASSDSDKSWDQNRKHLDDVFRNLASWKQDLEHYKPLSALHPDNSLISVVDGVITSFLTVVHRLMHLFDPSSKGTSIEDTVLLEVTQNLKKGVSQLQKEWEIADDYCPVCDQVDGLSNTSDYLDEIIQLVSELKEDSKPLQLAMRRRDWLEQATLSTRRLSVHFDESGGHFHKERHSEQLGQQTSRSPSPRRPAPSMAPKASQARVIAKPGIQRTRSMKSKGDISERVDET